MPRKALQKIAKKYDIKANQSNNELRKQLELFVQKKSNNKENEAESSESAIQFKTRSLQERSRDESSSSEVEVTPKKANKRRSQKKDRYSSSEEDYDRKKKYKKQEDKQRRKKREYSSSEESSERRSHRKSKKEHNNSSSEKKPVNAFAKYCDTWSPSNPTKSNIDWTKLQTERLTLEKSQNISYMDHLIKQELPSSYDNLNRDPQKVIQLLIKFQNKKIKLYHHLPTMRSNLDKFIKKLKNNKSTFEKLSQNIYWTCIDVEKEEFKEEEKEVGSMNIECIIYSLTSGLPVTISVDYSYVDIDGHTEEEGPLLVWKKDKEKPMDIANHLSELAVFLMGEEHDLKLVAQFIHACIVMPNFFPGDDIIKRDFLNGENKD
jgi:hypothetical protein